MSGYGAGYGRGGQVPSAMARALTRGRLMPSPGDAAAQLGYTPQGLLLADEAAHGVLHEGISNAELAAVGGVCLYGQTRRGLRGLYVPADAYGWTANQWNPALASQAVIGGFVATAHAAQDIGLFGYNAGTTPGRLYARIDTATDKVTVSIASTGAAQAGSVTIDHVLVFGDLYVLAYHINRTTGFLYTRLVNATTGIAYTGTPLDISTYAAITGTGSLAFHYGTITGAAAGTGITHLGLAVFNSGIAAADVVTNLTSRLVGV